MQIKAIAPLSASGCKQFHGMAFDGNRFYLTDKLSPQIIILNDQLQLESCVPTCRVYTCLCYDNTRHCFWAAAERCFCSLFQLDCQLQEIDKLSLAPVSACITGVSHCCGADCLLVSTPSGVLRVDKLTREPPQMLYSCKEAFFTGVCCVSPCYLCHLLENGKQKLFAACIGQPIPRQLKLPDDLLLQTVVYAGEQCGEQIFYLLATRHGCYPYLAEAAISSEKLCPPVSDDSSHDADEPQLSRSDNCCGCGCRASHAHAGETQSSPTLPTFLALALAAAEQAMRHSSHFSSSNQPEESSPQQPESENCHDFGGCTHSDEFPSFFYRQPFPYPFKLSDMTE